MAQKDNTWAKRNISRWRGDEDDRLHTAAQSELDSVKRAAMFVKLNEVVIADGYIIPVVFRPRPSAQTLKLVAPLSGWDNDLWALANRSEERRVGKECR